MVLTDRDVSVRDARPGDAPRLAAWWADGKVMAHAGFPLGIATDLEALRAQLADATAPKRRLILESGGLPVGEMCYFPVSEGTVEIGIKICDFAYQGRGIGTRALRLLIGYLFGTLHARRIILDTNRENTRAQHVYEKLGFVRTGVRENCWKDQLGVPQTAVDYALTREAFSAALPPEAPPC